MIRFFLGTDGLTEEFQEALSDLKKFHPSPIFLWYHHHDNPLVNIVFPFFDFVSKADDHGKVAALAEDLLGSVQWSDAIEAADSPRIFPVGKIFHYLLLIEILAFVISNTFCSEQRFRSDGRLYCALQWVLHGNSITTWSQHTELTYLKHCATFLPVNHCTASYQHCSRLPTLPTWPALQAARQRSTLPPSWASGCRGQPSNEFYSHFFLSPATARPPVPTVTRSPSPMRASPCSLTTTTTTSWAASYLKYLWIRSGNPQKFVPQFNYYLTRGCQTNPFQLQLISDWMQADKLFWR